MPLVTVPANTKGFDTNIVTDTVGLRAMYATGHRFAARYIRRVKPSTDDLSISEIQRLHAVGLAVTPVQHFEHEPWLPSRIKGTTYGQGAVDAVRELKFPLGGNVWLDLEAITAGTPPDVIISYCNNWYDLVAGAGYLPGLYVGWNNRLTPQQLHDHLKFTRYWGSYNLNADMFPAIRGLCMKQSQATREDWVEGVKFFFDVDHVRLDLKGGLPTMYAPEGWAA